jgi:hypothetical protein
VKILRPRHGAGNRLTLMTLSWLSDTTAPYFVGHIQPALAVVWT